MSSQLKTTTTTTVYAGIDVAAAELVLALQRGDVMEPAVTLPNTPAGHRQLTKLLTRRNGTARVCLEATGVYGLGLALALQATAGIEVMVVNPRAIRDFQRARLTRAKTDAVDAAGILQFLLRMDFVPWTPPPAAVLELQQIARRMGQLRDELTREQARLHAISFTPARRGPIARDLALGIRQLEKRLKTLQAAAAQAVATEPTLQRQVQHLCTVPGIAQLSAFKLLGELLALPDCLKAKQWVAHAGLDPRPRQSGTCDAPRHISRTGNRQLRHALFMPALVAIQRSPEIRATYEGLLARGKKKKVAIVAIMRRLLHAIWGILHHQQPFNPLHFHAPTPPTA